MLASLQGIGRGNVCLHTLSGRGQVYLIFQVDYVYVLQVMTAPGPCHTAAREGPRKRPEITGLFCEQEGFNTAISPCVKSYQI
jgi:hypothetical protein